MLLSELYGTAFQELQKLLNITRIHCMFCRGFELYLV